MRLNTPLLERSTVICKETINKTNRTTKRDNEQNKEKNVDLASGLWRGYCSAHAEARCLQHVVVKRGSVIVPIPLWQMKNKQNKMKNI
jgi:hypothetical protein